MTMLERTKTEQVPEHAEHLEDLMDRVRLGRVADAAERRRVQEHLAGCPICALQAQNAAAHDRGLAVSALDAQLDSRVMQRAMQQLRYGRRPRRVSRRWVQVAVGTLLLSGTAAAASWWSVRNGGRSSLPAVGGSRAVAIHQDRAAAPSLEPGLDDNAPFVHAVDSVDDSAPVETAGAGSSATGARVGERHGSAASKNVSAAELFERARTFRLKGDFSGARATYRRLQHAHPDSREAHFSYLILGRMFLERGNPELGAQQFALYLAGGGGASEEALIGHATALGRMGRWKEEAADWRSLLAKHPASLYGDRARARLEELRHAHASGRAASRDLR